MGETRIFLPLINAQVQMPGGVALGAGDEVPGVETPCSVFLHKGVELPVHPDDAGHELSGDALHDHGVGPTGGGESVLRHVDDGVDDHVAGLGGAVLIADDRLQGHHVGFGVSVVGKLSVIRDLRP